MSNPYERTRRLEKATAIANVAEEVVRQIQLASDAPDEARGPDEAADALEALLDVDQHWQEFARCAGVNAPSLETRKLVVQLLRERATARVQFAVADYDTAGICQPAPIVAPLHKRPLGPGVCDWPCGSRATITLKAADGLWYRCCGACWAKLHVHADACGARTIQGGAA